MLHKRIADIDIDDVEKFCLQCNPEGAWLDYKQSISHTKANEQIAKLVSAFANAHGGWALFGVSEKKDASGRGIPDKLVGIDMARMPGDQIQQVSLNAIYPPVIPEMQWCPLKTDPTKGILVVRIFESDSTPHRLGEDEVRIRVNDISAIANEGKKASIDEIEMLLNRRQKSVELKQRLLARAFERAVFKDGSPQLRAYCLPLYPSRPLADWNALSLVAKKSRSWSGFRGANCLIPAHESLIERFTRSDGVGRRAALEFNVYGLTLLNTIIWDSWVGQDMTIKSSTCLTILDSVVRAADDFYKSVGFGGLVEFGVSLDVGTAECRFDVGNDNGETLQIPDHQFEITQSVLAHQLSDDQTLAAMVTEFLWAMGDGDVINCDQVQAIKSYRDQSH